MGPRGVLTTSGVAPAHFVSINYFLTMFPSTNLFAIATMKNKRLRMENSSDTTTGEVLNFFGAMILLTRMKFSYSREVRSTTSDCAFDPSMSFGQVMPLHRFETPIRCVRFPHQTE